MAMNPSTQKSSAASTEVMYLRVESSVKNKIDKLAETRYGGMRFASIVTSLLKYFVNLRNVALQDEMLGRGSATLGVSPK